MASMRPLALIAGNCAIAIAIMDHDNTSITSTMAPMNLRWRMDIWSGHISSGRCLVGNCEGGAPHYMVLVWIASEPHECRFVRCRISSPCHQDLASADRGPCVRDGHGGRRN